MAAGTAVMAGTGRDGTMAGTAAVVTGAAAGTDMASVRAGVGIPTPAAGCGHVIEADVNSEKVLHALIGRVEFSKGFASFRIFQMIRDLLECVDARRGVR